MLTVTAMSAVSVAAALVTLQRVVGWNKIIKHSTLVDVTFTIGLAVFMGGTLTGNLVALLGGLMMALVLTAIRYITSFKINEPAMLDDEHDANGNWIYNMRPYT